MAESNNIHYLKLRAIAAWIYRTFFCCIFACGIAMIVVQVINQYVESITIPTRRIPLIHILITLLILIMRSFDLIDTLEKIDKHQSVKGDAEPKMPYRPKLNGEQLKQLTSDEIRTQPQSHSEFLLQKKYQHAKTRIIVLFTCSGIIMFAVLASMFFFLFMYDFSLFKDNQLRLIDQILILIMIASAVTLFHIRAASQRIECLEKKLFSEPKKEENKTSPVECYHNPLLVYNFPPEIVDEKSHLKVSMAYFVRYCVQNKLFEPYTKQAWAPIDGFLYSKTNSPITAKQLAQSYQDQLTKGNLFE